MKLTGSLLYFGKLAVKRNRRDMIYLVRNAQAFVCVKPDVYSEFQILCNQKAYAFSDNINVVTTVCCCNTGHYALRRVAPRCGE